MERCGRLELWAGWYGVHDTIGEWDGMELEYGGADGNGMCAPCSIFRTSYWHLMSLRDEMRYLLFCP